LVACVALPTFRYRIWKKDEAKVFFDPEHASMESWRYPETLPGKKDFANDTLNTMGLVIANILG